ncbi:MAG TPA: glycosyltransferase [Chromatiaceae bacterium]|nr:glycosyltransferase [Chromatiaceae bacterium]
MRISAIIVTLNEEAHLPRLLADLAAFKRAGHEIVVVDGGSVDATRRIARDGAHRVLRGEPGRASQMNAGAGVATGDVFWFLHADSRLDGDLFGCLASLSSPVWGRFDVRITHDAGRFHGFGLWLVAAMMNRRSCLSGIATGDQGIFVSRDLFRHVGGFPRQALMEDIELSRRLKMAARPLCLHRCITTSGRRWCRRGLTRTVILMWWLRLAYWLGVSPTRLAAWYR